jgi:hypothetical protein
MRAAIGLFTLCRAVAGLSAQDTVPVRGYQRQGSRLHLPDGSEHAFRYDGQTSDLVHQHPFMRMANPIFGQHGFCTTRMYRVWVEFQRNGVVNTARFDIPVKPLE